jgi:hypothetical protein
LPPVPESTTFTAITGLHTPTPGSWRLADKKRVAVAPGDDHAHAQGLRTGS